MSRRGSAEERHYFLSNVSVTSCWKAQKRRAETPAEGQSSSVQRRLMCGRRENTAQQQCVSQDECIQIHVHSRQAKSHSKRRDYAREDARLVGGTGGL